MRKNNNKRKLIEMSRHGSHAEMTIEVRGLEEVREFTCKESKVTSVTSGVTSGVRERQ